MARSPPVCSHPRVETPSPVTGSTLAHYVLERTVAVGPGGTVYRAIDTRQRKYFALKVLAGDRARADHVARLEQERARAAHARDPLSARIHEVGRAVDEAGVEHAWVATAWVEGASIEARWPACELEARVAHLAQAARGVAYLHDLGLTHRNLKAANVLLGADGRAVVVDRGLAPPGPLASLPSADLAYVAPELLDGAEPQPTSDVWALGVLLHSAISGESTPSTGRPGRPPSLARAALPARAAELGHVYRAATTVECERRHPDARAFADELERWLAGGTIPARPPTNRAPATRPPTARAPSARPPTVRASLAHSPARRGRRLTAFALLAIAIALVVAALAGLPAWGSRTRAEALLAQARAAQQAGQWSEGIAACEALLALAPSDEVRALLAQLRERVALAHELASDRLDIAYARAQRERWLVPIAGQLERARAAVTDPTASVPRLHAELATALESLAARAREDPVFAHDHVWRLLARGWRRIGRPDRAQEALDAALAGAPDEADLHLELARAHHVSALEHRASGAPGTWAKAQASAHDARAAEHYARAASALDGLGEPERRLERARESLCRGEPTRALEALGPETPAPGDDPELAAARHALVGWCQPPATAAAAWTKALELAPHDALVRLARGAAYLLAGEPEAALADLDRAIELAPGRAAAYVVRGHVRERMGVIDGALADYDCAVEVAPGHADAHAARGHCLRGLGQHEAGLTSVDRALAIFPDHVPALVERALCRLDSGHVALALSDLDRALVLAPNRGDAVRLRGLAHERAGRDDLALTDYVRAVELDPTDDEARLARAGALLRGARVADALADTAVVIARAPEHWRAHFLAGACRAALGERAPAVSALERARASCPPEERPMVDALLARVRAER